MTSHLLGVLPTHRFPEASACGIKEAGFSGPWRNRGGGLGALVGCMLFVGAPTGWAATFQIGLTLATPDTTPPSVPTNVTATGLVLFLHHALLDRLHGQRDGNQLQHLPLHRQFLHARISRHHH